MSNSKKKDATWSKPSGTESFLVRVWREPSEAIENLRVFARQLRTGEQRHFAEIQDLEPYLRSKMPGVESQDEAEQGVAGERAETPRREDI